MSTSTATRNASWAKVRGELPYRQLQVLSLLKARGPLTDRAIAKALGVFPSQITAPRGQLVKAGLIEVEGTKVERLTDRTVTVWRAAEQPAEDHSVDANKMVAQAAAPRTRRNTGGGYVCAGCGDSEPPFLVVNGRALCGPCNAGESLVRAARGPSTPLRVSGSEGQAVLF